MEKITAVVCGKEYTLRFDMESWEKLEDEVCLIDDMGDKLAGKGRIRAISQVFAILAKADFDEIWKNAKPSEMRAMTKAIWAAINDGMHMETERGGDREVDVTLEEIEKKEEPAV